MPKADITPLGTARLNLGLYGMHQVCALLIALEHSSGEMESGDVTAAISGINNLVRQINLDMDKAMLEGADND
ncbi:hypothetical protein [Pantoea ananatis]|uniref:hypothetical protein n=1 Tax=Pantoea ananas TaxID=553 RepID=UPI000D5D4EAA|nr:hypothetical protein [Pantoea ananatis]PVY82793.1 hypothetical protein C7427_109193 [Pantoea ananatis]